MEMRADHHRKKNDKKNDDDGDDDERAPLVAVAAVGSSAEAAAAVRAADLTWPEKVSLLSGASFWTTVAIERLGVPALCLSDGPHGVRRPVREMALHQSHPATCFPTAAALACSWDCRLVQRVGEALQEECVYYNVHVLLGPGLNLKRHPCGGRNFEYFSEDPLLSGRLAAAHVQGVQSTGRVAACPKHFVANNQESHRFVVSAAVDERTLRELYLKGFEITVRGSSSSSSSSNSRPAEEQQQQQQQQQQPATLMCAYNRLNGEFCSEHRGLLTAILRDEWNFRGLTVTDWGATSDRAAGLRAGLDLEMPGGPGGGAHRGELRDRIQCGGRRRLDEQSSCVVDRSVQRLLNLAHRYGSNRDDDNSGTAKDAPVRPHDPRDPMWQRHHELAHRAALDCCVLLRNQDSFLPLDPIQIQNARATVALIGAFARDHPRYQGMGSSAVRSAKVVTVHGELQRFVPLDRIRFAAGYRVDDVDEAVDAELLSEAVATARGATVVILCVGLPEIGESEGFDRDHLRLPAPHRALVDAVGRANPNVVVVLSNGGAVELPFFGGNDDDCHDDGEHVPPKAILETYLLGEAGGAAVVDLLFGVQSPCGKLAETFALQQSDILADRYFPGDRHTVQHREGLLVGYRYFDTAGKAVRYPFGHGLSYTTFAYGDLAVSTATDESDRKSVQVTFAVTNTGSVEGKEIVQCYVHAVDSNVFRPEQELKEFAKISLTPGERKEVHFVLTDDAFSFYDIGIGKWVVERGTYEVRIGSSSRDIRLQQALTFQSGMEASQVARESYPPEKRQKPFSDDAVFQIDDAKFSRRFGDKRNEILDMIHGVHECTHPMTPFHRNSLLKEVAEARWVGKILLYLVYKGASHDMDKQGPARRRGEHMVMENVKNLPLRALVLFSRGGLSFDALDALIDLMNLRYFAALKGFGKALYHLVRPKRYK